MQFQTVTTGLAVLAIAAGSLILTPPRIEAANDKNTTQDERAGPRVPPALSFQQAASSGHCPKLMAVSGMLTAYSGAAWPVALADGVPAESSSLCSSGLVPECSSTKSTPEAVRMKSELSSTVT